MIASNPILYNPFVVVINADDGIAVAFGYDSPSSLNSSIENFLPQEGIKYKIQVTSFNNIDTTLEHPYQLLVSGTLGDITLTPRLSDFLSPQTGQIVTLNGTLNSDDFTFPSLTLSLFGDRTLADELELSATAFNQPLQISLVSSNPAIYDPYLQIVDARTGNILAEDNDNGDGTNSLISNFLPQGGVPYRIRVTSFDVLVDPTIPRNYTLQASASIGTVTLTPRDEITGLDDPIYRFYNPTSRRHFFTASLTERNSALAHPEWGYQNEEVGFIASDTSGDSLIPIYRFYNYVSRGHFFTASEPERNDVLAHPEWGYSYENVGFYAYSQFIDQASPVYRFYNATSRGHFFTNEEVEKNNILAHPEWGYTFEQVGFRAGLD